MVVELKKPKTEIVKKAHALAKKYEAHLKSCGQCTFLAIIHALKWGGLEIIPEDTEERFFSGLSGFTGGTSMVVDGTCSAINSSIITLGLALGTDRNNQDDTRLRKLCATIRNTILEKFYQEYKSILCRDILNVHFGRVWNLTDDNDSDDFLQVSHGCAIMQAAAWATEIILDEFEKGDIPIH